MHRTIFPDLKAVLGKVALGHTANALTDSVAEVGVLHFLTSIVYFQIYIHLPDVEFSLVLLKTQSWNSDNSHISRFLDSRIHENILLGIYVDLLHLTQVNIGLALALLRGLAKDEVRTGAWEENKVLLLVVVGIIVMIMVTSVMMMTRTLVKV